MDVVLGVAMTSDSVRFILTEGEDGDGALVDHDSFEVNWGAGVARESIAEHVVNAVLGTYGVASANDHHIKRIAVTWTDPVAAEAATLVDALDELGLTNVSAVTGCDAGELLAEHIARTVGPQTMALCVLERDNAFITVVHNGENGAHSVRTRGIPAIDRATVLTAVRGVCANAPADIGAVYVAGSSTETGLLCGELNLALSVPVTIPQDAALAFARGAALTGRCARAVLAATGSDNVFPLVMAADAIPAKPTLSVFVPRTAKLLTAPGVDTHIGTAETTDARGRRVRILGTVVGAGVLTFVASLSMAIGQRMSADDHTPVQAEARNANAELPVAPAEAPPAAQAAPDPAPPANDVPALMAAPAKLPAAPAPAPAAPLIIPASAPAPVLAPPAAVPAGPPPLLAALPALLGGAKTPSGGSSPIPPGTQVLAALPALLGITGTGAPGGGQGLPISPQQLNNPLVSAAALQVAQKVVPPAMEHADQPITVPQVPGVTDGPITLPPLRDMVDSVRPDRQDEAAHFGVDVPRPALPYYQPPGAPVPAPAPDPAAVAASAPEVAPPAAPQPPADIATPDTAAPVADTAAPVALTAQTPPPDGSFPAEAPAPDPAILP